MPRYKNHGYIGFNVSGGPVGVLTIEDHYLTTAFPMLTASEIDEAFKNRQKLSQIQAGTLAFVNVRRVGTASEPAEGPPDGL